MTTKVLGGFVRTFYFDEESNADVIDGEMQIEYDLEQIKVYPITVVVLEHKDNSSEIGDAIVGHTQKLSGYGGGLLVRAYFSAFAHKIQKYIVAYEPFARSSIWEIRNPTFFSADGLQLDLTEYWRKRMRSFIKLLHYAAQCEIKHGSLLSLSSYVTCRGDQRIINVGKVYHDQYEAGKDMEDLMHLISKLFPDSSTNYEWVSLKNLLISKTMSDPATVQNFLRIALGHPILLGTVEEKLECFVTLHDGVMDLDDAFGHRARFSNRIHRDYPQLRRFFSSDLQDKVASEYDFRFRRLVPWNKLYYGLFTFRHASYLVLTENTNYGREPQNELPMNQFLEDLRSNTWSPRYGERYIYINIIRLVQKLIKHGANYCPQFGDLNHLLTEIKTRFSHNMCACYTLLNTKKDWITEPSFEPYGRLPTLMM
ncbi:hypothetical protein VPH35_031701 [Triticum aestivum]